MNYVIIGAGPAGVVAAETLRKHDRRSRITLIGDEGEPPYSRMALPYVMINKITEQGTHLRQTQGHFDDLKIRYLQAHVSAIDTDAKTVALDDGKSLKYDKLLLATGSHPVRPKIKGLTLPGVHTCWTLEDARQIDKLAQSGAHVVLMGAGFIGSIVLEALVTKGVSLSVVEMEDRMVPRMMDEIAGNMLKSWCKSKGVRVLTGTKITEISESDKGLKVTLNKGKIPAAQLVVVAAGVRSNTDFLKGSGIETKDGVVVDDHLQTNIDGIYAAGDVARAKDLSTGQFNVLAIQPVAVEHGRIAAMNMVGLDTPHRGSLSMNVLDTLGLISCSFGQWMGGKGSETARTVDKINYRYMRLEFQGDCLIGAQSVGFSEHIGMVRGLIQSETKLGKWKQILMNSPHRISEAYVSTLHKNAS